MFIILCKLTNLVRNESIKKDRYKLIAYNSLCHVNNFFLKFLRPILFKVPHFTLQMEDWNKFHKFIFEIKSNKNIYTLP